ncbi:MAG: transposase [Calothrix sp. MO_192.B10]|nr:transposase [Calothrix sp. MO_192.B10]
MALRRATFRLYPTKKVDSLLHYHRRLHQELYNAAVSNRITSYKKFAQSVSYLDQQNCLPEFKQVWTEYKQINSQALQATLKPVDFAFQRFFKGLANYPNFKSIHRYSGWSYPSKTGCKVHSIGDNGYLELAKIGQIQMRGKARVWGHPKALDIVYRNGKWYASIVLDIDDTLLKNNRKTDDGVIAIDLGCNDAIAWTNGEENGLVPAPRFLRKAEQKIKQLSQGKRRKPSPNFQKKQTASRRWNQAQKQVSNLYRQVKSEGRGKREEGFMFVRSLEDSQTPDVVNDGACIHKLEGKKEKSSFCLLPPASCLTKASAFGQKSLAMLGDVETPGSNEVSQG